jgi:biotin synthase
MIDSSSTTHQSTPATGSGPWDQMAESVLSGEMLSRDACLEVLAAPDDAILDLMAAAYRVRRRYFCNTVQFYYLMNAKSGICPEDCGYCSQSKVSEAEIPQYNLLNAERILDGARIAAENDSKTYCIVISARGPSQREMDALTSVVPQIKEAYDLKICACLGLLTPAQALALKQCGVDRVNHNLNTSEAFYGEICTTHGFGDRIDTLEAVRAAGLELCSGGIIGMGERDADVVDMALRLRDLGVHSIPLNFLNPIDGTPLQGIERLNPRYCLKALAMFRLVNPDRELRIAGGREIHLRSLQALGLYAANSIFVGDYLTTKGQAPEQDIRMIEDLGFTVTRHEEVGCDARGSENSTSSENSAV